MQSSTYTIDSHTQADGRIYVRETHTDASGVVHIVDYLAPADWTATEYTATMTTRAVQIDADLAAAEAAALMGQD